MRYLTDTNVAAMQAGAIWDGQSWIGWGQSLAEIGPGQSYTQSAPIWAGTQYYLFEGSGIGFGELVLRVQRGTNVLAETSAWIDLHDVRDLYERSYINVVTSTNPVDLWTSTNWVENPSSGAADEDSNIIVYVHGFDNTMSSWLVRSDTVFKRLYWAGYRGKFASIRWPCKLLPPKSLDPFSYNLSELYAFKSAYGLREYLNQLRVRFPAHRLHIFAHSQGNAVASEAARLGAPFDTYILAQGAVPASCYDVTVPTLQRLLDAESVEPTPEWGLMGYRGSYTNLTGRIINFYNTVDYALATGTFFGLPVNWEENQYMCKPDGLPGARNYASDGSNGYAIIDVGLYRLVTDSQECRAMVSRSRTKAVGAQSGVCGVVSTAVDLQADFGFGRTREEHSAQFARPIQTVKGYYDTVLDIISTP